MRGTFRPEAAVATSPGAPRLQSAKLELLLQHMHAARNRQLLGDAGEAIDRAAK